MFFALARAARKAVPTRLGQRGRIFKGNANLLPTRVVYFIEKRCKTGCQPKGEKVKIIQLAVLNIVLPPPHSPERYIKLFRDTFRLKNAAKLRGSNVGMIGGFKESVAGAEYVGELYKYFDLDKTAGWFNVTSQKPTDLGELDKITIPDELKPHFQYFPYVLFPKTHRLVYISKDGADTLSPGMAEKLFNGLFARRRILEEYGEVTVTVEPEHDVLSRVWGLKRLKQLSMSITPQMLTI